MDFEAVFRPAARPPFARRLVGAAALHRFSVGCALAGSSLLALSAAATAQQVDNSQPAPAPDNSQPAPAPDNGQPMPEVTVTAPREDLLGTASTASQGVISDQQIQLTPAYRPGQILETVPGLTVTSHSGEGKANQYLMRGYNLDHGTDLETDVDGMPINQPTHAHGQGYTDLNFMIPELADQITYTKGPYYADVGDFGAVGSVRISYRDIIADQVAATIGTLGYARLFGAASQTLGAGHLLQAVELQHYDGPFVVPDDQRKENVVLRYGEEGQDNGFSLTGMFYHDVWTNTTDIPLRAVPDIGYFGSLNPTDGGHAMRGSLSANYHAPMDVGQFTASAFYIYNSLNLYNDFTHFLIDPVHGDQEDQFENRNVIGGATSYSVPVMLGGVRSELLMGGLTRYDILDVGRLPSEGQAPLSPAETASDPASFSNHDEAGYTNGGARGQQLVQPKGSLIFTPRKDLEFYVSAGEGFHSADLRGVNQSRSVDLGIPESPLLARQYGEEVGVRAKPLPSLALTFAVYNLWQQSETIIDPDVGMDVAGPPSERYGFELNTIYAINQWLDLDGNFSANHARFTSPFDDGTGHLGEYIPDAPFYAGSFALQLHDLGRWSGGLVYRLLGDFPISSGPCNDAAAVHDFPGVATSCANAPTAQGQVNGKGYGQLNLDVHYAFPQGWIASLGIYNLLDTHAPAAEFYYVDRLQSEITTYPDGRADIHEHPLEPLMARMSLAKQF